MVLQQHYLSFIILTHANDCNWMDLLIHTPIQTFIEYQKNKMREGEIPMLATLKIFQVMGGAQKVFRFKLFLLLEILTMEKKIRKQNLTQNLILI